MLRSAAVLWSEIGSDRFRVHLGAGCSATVIRRGQSIDTSMGMTLLEGLMMGTRSGDIDPAIFALLASRENLLSEQVERILNHESGLLGVSAISDDLRPIEAALESDHNARSCNRDVLLSYSRVYRSLHGGTGSHGHYRVWRRHRRAF